MQYDETRGRAATHEVLTWIRALPGISCAALGATVPFGDFHEGLSVERGGRPARSDLATRTNAAYRVIGSEYFKTLDLPMTEAEELSATAPRVAIIDERLARKLFGADDPLGQMIRYTERPGETTKNGGEPMEIVGIAARRTRCDLSSGLTSPARRATRITPLTALRAD